MTAAVQSKERVALRLFNGASRALAALGRTKPKFSEMEEPMHAAAVKAVAVTDECIGRVIEATRARGGIVIVTSDHGNAEQMLDPDTGAVQTAHTTNDVECVLVSDAHKATKLRPHGVLADIGPTVLELLGLPIPPPVTAESLIAKS